ncbi:MAG: hypothetical protein K8T26_03310 [Lentisphaerae bacterium]|nr:hypothetical protein [Lentisphaerota bacterium]
MQMTTRTYCSILLATCTSLLVGVGVFNWYANPFLLPPPWCQNHRGHGFADPYEAVSKAVHVLLRRPPAVILGTSRAEIALNPERVPWRGTYNFALRASSFSQITSAYYHAVNSGAERCLMGLDFFVFNATWKGFLDFDASLFRTRKGVPIQQVIQIAALGISLSTVKASGECLKAKPAADADRYYNETSGQANWRWFEKRLTDSGGHRASMEKVEQVYVQSVLRPPPGRRYQFRDESGYDTLEAFRAMVRHAKANKVELVLYLSPTHARDQELIRALGLWDTYEQWKREVTGIACAEGFDLYDFSGYNTVTTESVPPRAQPDAGMQYWWESTHAKEAVGDMIIGRLFARESDGSVPPDFGLRLTAETVDAQLLDTRQARARYAQTHAQECEEIAALVVRFVDPAERLPAKPGLAQ